MNKIFQLLMMLVTGMLVCITIFVFAFIFCGSIYFAIHFANIGFIVSGVICLFLLIVFLGAYVLNFLWWTLGEKYMGWWK